MVLCLLKSKLFGFLPTHRHNIMIEISTIWKYFNQWHHSLVILTATLYFDWLKCRQKCKTFIIRRCNGPFPRWEGEKSSSHQINLSDYHLFIWQNLYSYVFTFRYCKNKSLRLSENKNAKYTTAQQQQLKKNIWSRLR